MRTSVIILGGAGCVIGLYGFASFESAETIFQQSAGINVMILAAVLIVGAFIVDALLKRNIAAATQTHPLIDAPHAKLTRFEVQGVDGDTGAPSKIIIEAPSRSAAEELANKQNIFWSSINEVAPVQVRIQRRKTSPVGIVSFILIISIAFVSVGAIIGHFVRHSKLGPAPSSVPVASGPVSPVATEILSSSGTQPPGLTAVADGGVVQVDVKSACISYDLLYIVVTVRNVSSDKKVGFRVWGGEIYGYNGRSRFDKDYSGSLSDNKGNSYAHAIASELEELAKISIYPGSQVDNTIIFEPPIAAADWLDLKLPMANIGGNGFLTLRIPSTFIVRRSSEDVNAPSPEQSRNAGQVDIDPLEVRQRKDLVPSLRPEASPSASIARDYEIPKSSTDSSPATDRDRNALPQGGQVIAPFNGTIQTWKVDVIMNVEPNRQRMEDNIIQVKRRAESLAKNVLSAEGAYRDSLSQYNATRYRHGGPVVSLQDVELAKAMQERTVQMLKDARSELGRLQKQLSESYSVRVLSGRLLDGRQVKIIGKRDSFSRAKAMIVGNRYEVAGIGAFVDGVAEIVLVQQGAFPETQTATKRD